MDIRFHIVYWIYFSFKRVLFLVLQYFVSIKKPFNRPFNSTNKLRWFYRIVITMLFLVMFRILGLFYFFVFFSILNAFLVIFIQYFVCVFCWFYSVSWVCFLLVLFSIFCVFLVSYIQYFVCLSVDCCHVVTSPFCFHRWPLSYLVIGSNKQ